MKKKLIRSAIAIFFLFIAILIAAPLAINTSSLKSQLEQKISQKIGASFEVKGGVKIVFLPLPQISLNDTAISSLAIDDQYSSDIKIRHLVIKPNILSLFSKKIEIDSLIFDNPNIDNNYKSKTETKETPKPVANQINSGLLNHIFNFSDDEGAFDFDNIKSIQVKNGYFVSRNLDKEVTLEFRSIKFSLKNNLTKQIFTVEGGFLSDEEPTSFILTANAKNNAESSLIIQSSILNLSLSGKFSNSHIYDLIKSNFTGKIDANIMDLKALLNKYVSKNNLLYRKINSTQPIKISAKIENKAGEIDIANIIINSALMEGTGQINANLTKPKPTISANFDFNNIDIDSVWFSGALNNNSSVINFENEIIRKFLNETPVDLNDEDKTHLVENTRKSDINSTKPFFNNSDLTAKIKIKTAKYYNNDLHNVSLNFVNINGNLFLQPLSVEIPGKGLLELSGALERDNDIPKFTGKVSIIGGDFQKSLSWLGIDNRSLKPQVLGAYKLNSDVLMLPSYNIFSNFSLEINNNKNIIIGSLKNDDSTGTSNTTANLRINYLNYDDYFLTTTENQYLSPKSLLKKLLWLNTIDSNHDIALSFDQLVYQGNNFNNESFRVKFGPGYLKFSDLSFSSPNLDFKGSVELDISNNNPTLNINILSNNFQYQSPTSIISDKTDNKNSSNNFFADLFFSLPAVDEFGGKVDIDIKNLMLNSWQASDVKIAGKMKKSILNFDNFSLKTYKGEAKYKGGMVFKTSKTINGSIELIGVDSGQVLQNLIGIDNINGVSNISALVNSSAENKAEFFKNLDASGQFIGSNVAVKGFGIYDLAVKMAQPKKYQDELGKPETILYNPDSISIFKDISGAFAIKKNGGKDQFSIQASSLGINGVISGEFDLGNQNIDANANFIFISGSRQIQVPINMAVNFKGKAGEFEKSNNLTQVDQYLKQRLATPTSP